MFKKLQLKEFIDLMSFMRPRIWMYTTGLIGNSIVNASLGIVTAFILKDMFRAAVEGQINLLVRAIVVICAMLLFISVLSAAFTYMYSYCVKKTMSEIRLKVFNHIEGLPVKYFEQKHSGDLISRITNDIQVAEQIYSEDLYSLITSVFYSIGCSIALFVFEWRVAVILLVLGIISAVINTHFIRPLREVSDRVQEKMGSVTELATDLLAGVQVIKIFNIGKSIINNFDRENDQVAALMALQAKKSAVLNSINLLIGKFGFISIVVFGTLMILKDILNFGTIVAMVQLAEGANSMFSVVGMYIGRIQASMAGANRVLQLLRECEEPKAVASGNGSSGQAFIEMRDVAFDYEEGKNVLEKVNFTVKQGEIAALVGLSGGGKSTIFKLLLGFYPVKEGMIIINGKSICQYTLTELRNMIAYVPQDAYLFEGTIEENIRHGMPGASREEIVKAAKAAFAHQFIIEQPDAYDTLVGERGSNLSGGQRQRIAIARAMLKNAPILLLDEPTSALDSQSEHLVQQALKELMKNSTVLIIAHRFSTIKDADIIHVVDNSTITEHGKHEELIGKSELYRWLYEAQFESDEALNLL